MDAEFSKLIYLDNAATTRASDGVISVMEEAMREDFFNASALYGGALAVSNKLLGARNTLKGALRADGEIYFTSGGTESNNTALLRAKIKKKGKVIIGQGEHDSVFNVANELKNLGYEVAFAPIKADGGVDAEAFEKLLDENVRLVSVMHVSNETGAINDVKRLVRATKRVAPDCIFHSDGVQAFGKIPVNLRDLGVDLYSVSAHKIHGPKGVGALYVRSGVSLKPLLIGGGQEKGMRSGTEDIPSILGFEQAVKEMKPADGVKAFRDAFLHALLSKVSGVKVISPEDGIPHILTVAFDRVRGEVLLHALEDYGILVGTGSACASHHESRFKRLFGLDQAHTDGVIRFSFSGNEDMQLAEYVTDCVKKAAERLKI